MRFEEEEESFYDYMDRIEYEQELELDMKIRKTLIIGGVIILGLSVALLGVLIAKSL